MPVRATIAKNSLILAIIVLVPSGFMMCACPGGPAVAALFAVIAACVGAGCTRICAVILLVPCVIGFNNQMKAKDREQEILSKVRRFNATKAVNRTNSIPQ